MKDRIAATLAPLRGQVSHYGLMLGLVGILALMILPLPPLILDLLLAVNITVSVVVMLTSIYVFRPLDFSVFPALLLVTTLFRLGLNVASTRLILLGAAQGKAEAGNIIKTFGQFVVGGSSLVGVVVFLILVIINFMVITKGSGRIAEVAARFTLDALPGKQMSIDAEMASGALGEEEARKKRSEVQREADFYGAMDGASKFVRGDAIAGLLITGINILGGLLIGVIQGGLGVADALSSYTVLTVGDGLVSQIPALLISTAAGIIVTRAASDRELGQELSEQLAGNEKVLYGAAFILGLMGLIPGMPFLVFGALAAGCIWTGRKVSLGRAQTLKEEREAGEQGEERSPGTEVAATDAVETTLLTLEIGYGLIALVDEKRGAVLVGKLQQMRRHFAQDMGVVIPPIFIRDNLELAPGGYRVLLKGNPIATGQVMEDRLMAIDPGNLYEEEKIQGVPGLDPAFGLPAVWIYQEDRHRADALGYTVVDVPAVMTTHITEVVGQSAPEFVGWQELQERLDVLGAHAPKLVKDVVPGVVPFATLLEVTRRLLREKVSVRDLRSILEALAERAPVESSKIALTDHVRSKLAAQISAMYTAPDGVLYTAILARPLEERLRQCVVVQHGEPVLACDLSTAQQVFGQIEELMPEFARRDMPAVVLAPPDLRAPLIQFLSQFFPNVQVICHKEVLSSVQIASVGQLTLAEEVPAMALAS